MKISITILTILLLVALLSGCAAVVSTRPGDTDITVIPQSPGSGYIWIGDSWVWNSHSHSYTRDQGRWVQPRRPSSTWHEGQWQQKRGGWNYKRGHWK